MKFIVNRDQLLLPLQQIVNVIEKRQTMPILSNVLVDLKTNALTMTGTDLEIQIVSTLAVNNDQEFKTTIPARKLLDICRLLPQDADINFETTDDHIKLTSGHSRISFSTLPADDYPEFNETTLIHNFSIYLPTFKLGLEKTTFCMANQDVRYFLNGLLMHVSNSKLKLVASDGHRLSIFETELNEPSGIEAQVIIPRKGIMELSRILTDQDQQLNIQFSANNIRIQLDHTILSAKLVDARYPSFNKVIQQEFFNPITIDKKLLKDALMRTAILLTEKHKGVTLNIGHESLQILSHNSEHEEAEELVPIQKSELDLPISFNVQYLLDAVANIDSDELHMSIARNSTCCIFEDPNNHQYKFIVMPMRL